MKIRNGVPTKTDLEALCARNGLIHYPLTGYPELGVTYGTRNGANECAKAVADALRGHGFEVICRLADPSLGLTGNIKITPLCK